MNPDPLAPSTAPYPAAPWHMHGTAVARAFATPVARLALPPGLTPVHIAGWSTGLLAYVEYLPPSDLTYHELIWMPAMVRSGLRAVGAYVAKIYVDDEAGLRGGREIWGLPKVMARFTPSAKGVAVSADDGTLIDLEFTRAARTLPMPGRAVTLQRDAEGVSRFRARFTADVGRAQLSVAHFSASDPGWEAFVHRSALPAPALSLVSFDSVMESPERVGR